MLLNYYKDVFIYENLNKDEERKIFKESISSLTKEKIVKSYLKLTVKVANKYYFLSNFSNIMPEDILQEGIVGLLESIDKFDPYKGIEFSYYARLQINYSIKQFLRKNSSKIHIPHNKIYQSIKLNKIIDNEFQENGSIPSIKDLSVLMSCPEKYILELQRINDICFSEIDFSDSYSSFDIMDIDRKDKIDFIMSEIEKMDENEKDIFKLRYSSDKSWREIGEIKKMSHETARKIHEKCLDKVKKSANSYFES